MTTIERLVPSTTRERMYAVVDRAYSSRIEEYIHFQVDLCRQVDPELFVSLDVARFRSEVERELRASELDHWFGLSS